jgi:hypothetical protein
MKAIAILLLVLGSAFALEKVQTKTQGEPVKNVKHIHVGKTYYKKGGRRQKFYNSPCTYLKHLINKVDRLSKHIIATLDKRYAKYKTHKHALKSFRKTLHIDLRKLDILIHKVKRNAHEIAKQSSRAKYFKSKLIINEKENCGINKEMKRLSRVLHSLAHQHNIYMKKYTCARNAKAALKSDNRKYRHLIRVLNKEIRIINRQIVRVEKRRLILKQDLLNCRWALKRAKRLNKKCKSCRGYRRIRYRHGRKYYKRHGKGKYYGRRYKKGKYYRKRYVKGIKYQNKYGKRRYYRGKHRKIYHERVFKKGIYKKHRHGIIYPKGHSQQVIINKVIERDYPKRIHK